MPGVGALLAGIAPALAVLDRLGRIACLAVGGALGLGYALLDTRPIDAAIYWTAGHAPHYYADVWRQVDGYVYPPPLAQLSGLLPWPLFIVPWMLLVFASLWYATRWLSAPILVAGLLAWVFGIGAIPMISPLAMTVIGNPQAVVAAAIVLGFRHPAAWGFILLTKIGPGIGLVWFAVRREWRSLAIALGVTAVIAAISLVASTRSWADFIGFALGNYAATSPIPVVPIPLAVRIPMALLLVAWGARTDRSWTVPIAAAWCALALYESSYFLIWAAAVPLWVASRTAARSPL
jgi:hypothetical protein